MPKQLSILVVDDHADTTRVMGRLLSQNGHRVHTACSCSDARQVAAEHPLDLVLCDIGLPDGTGLELLRDLKLRYQDLKAIAVTGYGMASDFAEAKAAGFDDHLTKPIDFRTLEITITKVCPPQE